jgi:hypothetical protein
VVYFGTVPTSVVYFGTVPTSVVYFGTVPTSVVYFGFPFIQIYIMYFTYAHSL